MKIIMFSRYADGRSLNKAGAGVCICRSPEETLLLRPLLIQARSSQESVSGGIGFEPAASNVSLKGIAVILRGIGGKMKMSLMTNTSVCTGSPLITCVVTLRASAGSLRSIGPE
ncbi:unnamed protein product [Pleuronectes platessa]|uniref:Uncharacterized protein n=1 Tax=Pleuronectes platessa TaxID=8262 RepID=A0A9N7TNH1_PLEPL|nr:unnamed protein product [Pleuronectes platessa]